MPLLRSFFFALIVLLSSAGAHSAPIASNPKPVADSTPTNLSWRGDIVSARAFMNDIAKGYEKAGHGHIDVVPFSTLSGLDAVANGSVDLAGVARAKYPRRAEEQSINFIPVALDAVVLLVHQRNPVDTISLAQIRDIYLGRITSWRDLGGEDKPINLYSIAAPLDGVEYSLRELVLDSGAHPVAAPRVYLNTAKLEEAVGIDPAALGVSTLSVTWDNKLLKRLRVEGIAASSASIADGSYPLYNTLYLANDANSPRLDRIGQFLAYLAEPASNQILRAHQLVPFNDVDNLSERNDARTAFIDARLNGEATTIAAASATASAPTPTPVAAPRATLESRVRISPASAAAEAARENLARVEEANRARQAAQKKVTVAKERKKTERPVRKLATTTSKPKAAKAKPTPAATKAKPAKLAKSRGKPDPEVASKPDPKAASKATFGNVKSDATTAPAAPAVFTRMDAGAKTDAKPKSDD